MKPGRRAAVAADRPGGLVLDVGVAPGWSCRSSTGRPGWWASTCRRRCCGWRRSGWRARASSRFPLGLHGRDAAGLRPIQLRRRGGALCRPPWCRTRRRRRYDELARVVKPGGEIVLVNHVGAESGPRAAVEGSMARRSASLGLAEALRGDRRLDRRPSAWNWPSAAPWRRCRCSRYSAHPPPARTRRRCRGPRPPAPCRRLDTGFRRGLSACASRGCIDRTPHGWRSSSAGWSRGMAFILMSGVQSPSCRYQPPSRFCETDQTRVTRSRIDHRWLADVRDNPSPRRAGRRRKSLMCSAEAARAAPHNVCNALSIHRGRRSPCALDPCEGASRLQASSPGCKASEMCRNALQVSSWDASAWHRCMPSSVARPSSSSQPFDWAARSAYPVRIRTVRCSSRRPNELPDSISVMTVFSLYHVEVRRSL